MDIDLISFCFFDALLCMCYKVPIYFSNQREQGIQKDLLPTAVCPGMGAYV